MAEVSKIITEKQDDPWNVERPGQDAKKILKKANITYCRISKRLAVETTSFYCWALIEETQCVCTCTCIWYIHHLCTTPFCLEAMYDRKTFTYSFYCVIVLECMHTRETALGMEIFSF